MHFLEILFSIYAAFSDCDIIATQSTAHCRFDSQIHDCEDQLPTIPALCASPCLDWRIFFADFASPNGKFIKSFSKIRT